MDLFQTYSGGMTNVNTADLYRMQYSTFFALERVLAYMCRASYAGQYVLTGGNVSIGVSNGQMRVNIPKGYYVINNKLCCLKSNTYSSYVNMTQTNTIYEYNASDGLVSKTESGYSDYFVVLTQTNTYDPLGDKTFADSQVRQTWLIQGFTISITSTQPSYYFCRLRIKHSDSTVTLVEAPKNIYDVIGYRYGDTARESQLLKYGGDHDARMKLLTQHDYYLMNGGYINGVGMVASSGLTITESEIKEMLTGYSISTCKLYSTSINCQALLNSSVVYSDSSLFRPNISTDDISDIIIDKIDFVLHSGADVSKVFEFPINTVINFNAGAPSTIDIDWKDKFELNSANVRITNLLASTGQPTVQDGVSTADQPKRYVYGDVLNIMPADGGHVDNAITPLFINATSKKAPVANTDFDSFKICYRFRIK